MMSLSVQCVMNGLNMMTDHEVVNSLPLCVLDGDSVSKTTWEQLFKTVKLIGKSMNIAAASRGPVTLVLDRVELYFHALSFYTDAQSPQQFSLPDSA